MKKQVWMHGQSAISCGRWRNWWSVKSSRQKQASPAVTALLPQVQNHQADFIPQHVANQLWALAKLVEGEVLTPEQASLTVTSAVAESAVPSG